MMKLKRRGKWVESVIKKAVDAAHQKQWMSQTDRKYLQKVLTEDMAAEKRMTLTRFYNYMMVSGPKPDGTWSGAAASCQTFAQR